MTEDQEILLVRKLAGTCMSDSFVADEFGIDEDEIEEIMLNHGYERCPDCEWWCESSELVDSEGDIISCESCGGKRVN